MPVGRIKLKAGREKAVLNKHPWIFSGAVASVKGTPQAGDSVLIVDSKNQELARASYHPNSQILARIYSYDTSQDMDRAWIVSTIEKAQLNRLHKAIPGLTNMYRVLAHEADNFPGLVVDRYDKHICIQALNAATQRRKDWIQEALLELFEPVCIVERSDEKILEKDGLKPQKQILIGSTNDSLLVECHENSVNYLVDLWNGHKTGFYLDQRDNRALVAGLAKGKSVLNTFAYTGGFSMAALKAGASHVESVEASSEALSQLERNLKLNAVDASRHTSCQADVFEDLRRRLEQNQSFDLIVLDPPKFVSSQKALKRACRGYQDLNRIALRLLRPGGYLFSFSCSGLMPAELFQKIIFSASIEAQCQLEFRARLQQASDHPFMAHLPESGYLKGIFGEKR